MITDVSSVYRASQPLICPVSSIKLNLNSAKPGKINEPASQQQRWNNKEATAKELLTTTEIQKKFVSDLDEDGGRVNRNNSVTQQAGGFCPL